MGKPMGVSKTGWLHMAKIGQNHPKWMNSKGICQYLIHLNTTKSLFCLPQFLTTISIGLPFLTHHFLSKKLRSKNWRSRLLTTQKRFNFKEKLNPQSLPVLKSVKGIFTSRHKACYLATNNSSKLYKSAYTP